MSFLRTTTMLPARARTSRSWIGSSLLIAAAAAMSACSDAPSTVAPTAPVATPTSLMAALTAADAASCAASTPKRVDLVIAGRRNQTQDIGDVTVTSKGSVLTVKFATLKTYQLDYTSVLVGSTAADLPKRLSKQAYNQFLPNLVKHKDGVTTYSYDLPLSDIGRNTDRTIVIAAYATVEGYVAKKDRDSRKRSSDDDDDRYGNNDGRRGDDRHHGDDEDNDRKSSERRDGGDQTIAWAEGSSTAKKNGVSYFSYVVPACTTPTPPPPPPPPTPNPVTGAATITFDDGFETTYSYAYPILKKYGLLANVAVNSGPIDGGYPDYLTLPQLTELSDSGWAVVNHTVDHYDLTTLTPDSVRLEIAANKAWIDAHHFRGSSIFVVPYHSYNAYDLSVIKQYAVVSRGASATQFRPTPYDSLVNYPSSDPYALTGIEPFAPGYAFADAMTDLKRYLDAARTQKKFIDVFFHKLQPTDVPQFEAIAQLLSQYKDVIRTYDKLYGPSGALAAK